jgi:hypothetical protein
MVLPEREGIPSCRLRLGTEPTTLSLRPTSSRKGHPRWPTSHVGEAQELLVPSCRLANNHARHEFPMGANRHAGRAAAPHGAMLLSGGKASRTRRQPFAIGDWTDLAAPGNAWQIKISAVWQHLAHGTLGGRSRQRQPDLRTQTLDGVLQPCHRLLRKAWSRR